MRVQSKVFGETRRDIWVRVLLLATVAVGVARVWAVDNLHMSFVNAYADYKGLDMNTFLGSEIAKREVPEHYDSAVFSLLCTGLLLFPLLRRVGSGAPWARNLALGLAAAGALNTLGSLAVPSPWWYYLLTVIQVALTCVIIVLFWRTPTIEDPTVRHELEMRARHHLDGVISVRSRVGWGWVTAADCEGAARLGSPGTAARTTGIQPGRCVGRRAGGRVFDVRDLEVPAERGNWGAAPDAVRAACALLVSLTALAGLRAWMVVGQWPDFVRSYGHAHHLDMQSDAGWTVAELRTPGQVGAGLDLGLVLLLVLLVLGVLRRVSECRPAGVVLAVGVALDSLAQLAYPVPWWYVVASSMLALAAVTLVLLLLRPRTSMHLRPEPAILLEVLPAQRAQPPRPTGPA